MLQKKRKAEDNLNDTINKEIVNLNEEIKNNTINNNNDNIEVKIEEKDKGKKNKKDKKKKKDDKKDNEDNEKDSIKKDEQIDEKNNNIIEENIIENSDKKNNNSEKKTKDNNSNNILNYFKPKIKSSLSSNNNLNRMSSTFTFGRTESNNIEIENNINEENLNNNLLINKNQNDNKENNSNQLFPFEIKNNSLSFKEEYLRPDIPEKIRNYYLLSSNDITKENYIFQLQNYFSEIKKTQYQNHKQKTNTMKIIFIHDSFMQNKKFPEVKSSKIKGKNPFSKDEYLIDYDKDSEDEFMEENAEDIKSSDKEEEDEEEEEDEGKEEIDKFIVPDGHLSEDEISEKDILEERKMFENSRGKVGGIKDILSIRNDYKKPVIIDFQKEIKNNDDKYKLLINKLSISIFKSYNVKDDFNNNIDDDNNIENNDFPIKFVNKTKKNLGYKDSIKNHFEDIIRAIHGSFDTKEQVTIMLNEKYPDLSKKTLHNFFRDKCIKYKHNVNQKKYWIVKHETLNELNLSQNEIQKILDKNFNEFEEKEKKRLEEVELNRQKNGIDKVEKKNDEKENENSNINTSKKKQKKKKIIIKKEVQENKNENKNGNLIELKEENNNKKNSQSKESSEKKKRKKNSKKLVLNNMLITNFSLMSPNKVFNKINEKKPDNEIIIEINNNDNMDIDIEEAKN